jgi:hypothetical protein
MLLGNCSLDSQSALELSTLVRSWIETKLAHTGVELKVSASSGLGDQIIRIEGGLPKLPGTQTIMPNLNNGHQIGQALSASEAISAHITRISGSRIFAIWLETFPLPSNVNWCYANRLLLTTTIYNVSGWSVW